MHLTVFNLELSHISSFTSVILTPLYVQHYLLNNLTTFQKKTHVRYDLTGCQETVSETSNCSLFASFCLTLTVLRHPVWVDLNLFIYN